MLLIQTVQTAEPPPKCADWQKLAQTAQYQVAITTHQTDNNGKSKYSNMTVYCKQYKLYKHYNLEDLEKLMEETWLFC